MAVAARFSLASIITMTTMASTLVVLALVATTPTQIGPVGVTAWFLVLTLAIGGTLATLLHLIKKLIIKKVPGPNPTISLRQGLLLGFWATVNLALSSLRQLTLRDLLLSGVFVIIIELYLRLK